MPEFLVDRNLGRHILPHALRAAGFVAHTLWSIYNEAEEDLADVEFLRDAGRNQWAVLTADMSIRRRPHELAIVESEHVQMFALPRGDLAGADQVQRFTANLVSIVAACASPGPFIYSVLPTALSAVGPDP